MIKDNIYLPYTQKMTDIIFLESPRLILRPMQESDAESFTQMVNKQDIQDRILKHGPVSIEEEIAYIKKNSQTNLTIIRKSDKKIIGGIGRKDTDYTSRFTETGTMIGNKEDQGQGYGTEAKMILLDYLFNTCNLRKIYSKVISYNKESLDYSMGVGYKHEATLKDKIYKKGKYRGEHILVITKEDWEPKRIAYQKKYFIAK